MRSIKRYMCEKCSREFPTKEAALACEEHHTVPVEAFVPKNYKSHDDEFHEYGVPRMIIVKMTNGSFYHYEVVQWKEVEDWELPDSQQKQDT